MKINKKFFCIQNIDEPELGLLSLPSLVTLEKYLPIFIFPKTSVDINSIKDEDDPLHISQQRAMSFVNNLFNNYKMLGDVENVVFIGLNNAQKSYLSCFNNSNIITIDDETDIEFILNSINPKKQNIQCRTSELIKGVHQAIHTNSHLEIDEYADDLVINKIQSRKLVVLEDSLECSTIIGLNYASYISCDIEIINKPTISTKEIRHLIYQWKKSKNPNIYFDLSARIFPSVESIDFSQYEIATFFTYGAPYPLILDNIIPFTLVNTNFLPDNFVFNSVINQINKYNNAALIYSPKEFKEEETDFLITELSKKNLYVHPLIDNEATVYNTDCTFLEFPFDLLHICSHGGEVGGYKVIDELEDRNGDKFTVEYDEVSSIHIKGDESKDDKIKVESKVIWRKFNGYYWLSKELKEQNYSHESYTDINNKLGDSITKQKKWINSVDDSASIKCYDGNYQAMISHVAGNHTFPFIFNNSCYSWITIAEGFISTGCSGYIGTLWNIKNRTAVDIAKSFYQDLFTKSISTNLYDSMRKTVIHENDKHIFIYWGLPDSCFYESIEKEPKTIVASKLSMNYGRWTKWLKGGVKSKYKRPVQTLVDWNLKLITKYFHKELISIVKRMGDGY